MHILPYSTEKKSFPQRHKNPAYGKLDRNVTGRVWRDNNNARATAGGHEIPIFHHRGTDAGGRAAVNV